MLERIRNQITELRKEEERRYTYEAEFSFSKELPVQYSEWMNTIWDISNRDKIKIYLVSEGGESFDLKENVEEVYQRNAEAASIRVFLIKNSLPPSRKG